jgi:hypothetical protein
VRDATRIRAVPCLLRPQARDPYANRIDPENPPTDPGPTKAPEKTPTPSVAALGIPLYPNAEPYKDQYGEGAAQVQIEGLVTAILQTSDTPEKVVEFYKKRLLNMERSDEQEEGKPVIHLSEAYEGNGLHLIEISASNGKTRITLQNVRPTKSEADLNPPPQEVHVGTPGINPAGSNSTPSTP